MAEVIAALPEGDMQQPKQLLNFLQVGISDVPRDSSYVLSVMKLMFLMLIPKK